MRSSLVIGLAASLLLLSCNKGGGSGEAVARVDGEALTMDQIRARIDTTRGVSEAQVQQFVRRWLNDEVLYREALSRGLDKAPGIEERVSDYRRQMIVNALLDAEVYNDSTTNSTDAEVAAYYETHKGEFLLPNDVARMSYVMFTNRDAATNFRNVVVKGTSWQQAVADVEANREQATALIAKADSIYGSQQSVAPQELWRVASNSKEQEISFPISANNGYYILVVWKYYKQGQTAEQVLVANEIRGRLTVQRRVHQYESLVERLRAQHSIEVLATGLPSVPDSSKSLE